VLKLTLGVINNGDAQCGILKVLEMRPFI
jgi:hypothetical protein